MKREEKNKLTRRRIMDRALEEFSERGYRGSSVNTISAAQGVSKGIIYHYFTSKDELYLACVEECFQRLTDYLREVPRLEMGSVQEKLERYFSARVAFFAENPIYQPIFCEAVIAPPASLLQEIQRRRADFDALTVEILEGLLRPLPLRQGFTTAEVVELFQQFQDFVNAQYRTDDLFAGDSFFRRDEQCKKLLPILLYGVVDQSRLTGGQLRQD